MPVFEILSLPMISHITRQMANALSCTQALLTHIPVVFVTCVLNTPCTLISAPDSRAIKNPVIFHTSFSSESISDDRLFYSLIFIRHRLYASAFFRISAISSTCSLPITSGGIIRITSVPAPMIRSPSSNALAVTSPSGLVI